MAEMIDVLVPDEQEGTVAKVRNWLKRVGDQVAIDDPLVEIETDKVAQEIPAPAAGVLAEILMRDDDDAVPGAILGRIRTAAAAAAAEMKPTTTGSSTASSTSSERLERYSPAVRHAAANYGIDPATVAGTGKGGRVTRGDMDAAYQERQKATPELTVKRPEIRQAGSRMVPHSSMRLAIAGNMLNSVTAAPHVTALFEADFSAIIRHRDANKARLAAEGINLSYTAYLVSACVAAMRAVPEVNSRWHEHALEIFDDINVGVGTALGEKGLVVPVIHGAQHLSLEGIARKLQDLTTRARNNALTPADMRGGTFTVSNHGTSGSLLASPIIINQPQSAILGVGKLEKRVVVREVDGVDTIQVRPMAYVSLTVDHRSLDGHQTNAWLTRFVASLETWPS